MVIDTSASKGKTIDADVVMTSTPDTDKATKDDHGKQEGRILR